MKRIALLCVLLAVGCFAQLQVVENKPESRSGLFFGAGLGAGANAMKFVGSKHPINNALYSEDKSYASFVVSAKVGGYHYFTNMIGLRYYYNLDVNFNPGESEGNASSPIEAFYVLSGSHTLNTDAVVNVFASKNIEFAVIGGVGMGVVAGEYGSRYKTVYGPSSNDYVDFEFRFNLGARVMFDQKYGLEFMAKLPVTPATQVSGNALDYSKSSPYYFTLDFVMERF
ncbi:outer membrane beta-barrel protein [Helicobacter pametensis]|uniref:outer membrane beta-barrel protein n=1 Tax=Helicobacter pametensis TaxID=95149 RepID=UPI00047F20C4|nr:outer membrane beta-barrel protein [Helicobacter pametensis]